MLRECGWRRPRRQVHLAKPKEGFRATRPNEYWQIDATVIRLTTDIRINLVWSKYSNAQRVSSLHVYHHHERNHPGKENLLLFPASHQLPQSERKVRSRERLGRLLRFYHREAA